MTRVYWHMGQALLPEHFYAQEESLRAEAALRFGLLGLPSWGLGRLEWDRFLLPTGTLTIKGLSLVFESGTVLDIPGNAPPVSLDLKETGLRRASIYVQLKSGYDIVDHHAPGHQDEGIQRILQRVRLSTSASDAEQSFLLAEVECSASDVWSFRREYVPPLLVVRPGLLFDSEIERMEHIVKAFRYQLRQEIQENHLSGETQLLAKQALRSLLHFHAQLVDLGNQITPHPQQLFTALRALYIDACVLRDAPLDALDLAYDHTELAAGFDALLKPLELMAERGGPAIPYVEFQRREGQLYCDMDRNVRRARDVFLLLQKPHVGAKMDLSRVKLASPSRLSVVHERSLTGIPFTRIERPPFAQTLSSTVDIYAVSRGQEWDAAVGEGRIALFDVPQLEDSRLYLYCRVD